MAASSNSVKCVEFSVTFVVTMWLLLMHVWTCSVNMLDERPGMGRPRTTSADALVPAVLLMGVLGTMSTRRYVIVFTVLSMLYACFHNAFYLIFIIFRFASNLPVTCDASKTPVCSYIDTLVLVFFILTLPTVLMGTYLVIRRLLTPSGSYVVGCKQISAFKQPSPLTATPPLQTQTQTTQHNSANDNSRIQRSSNGEMGLIATADQI